MAISPIFRKRKIHPRSLRRTFQCSHHCSRVNSARYRLSKTVPPNSGRIFTLTPLPEQFNPSTANLASVKFHCWPAAHDTKPRRDYIGRLMCWPASNNTASKAGPRNWFIRKNTISPESARRGCWCCYAAIAAARERPRRSYWPRRSADAIFPRRAARLAAPEAERAGLDNG